MRNLVDHPAPRMQKRAWTAFCLLSAAVAVTAVALVEDWSQLGIVWSHGEPTFGDWRVYTSAVDCLKYGQDPYDASSPCLFRGVPSNAMPYVLRLMEAAGLSAELSEISGQLLIATFFAALANMPTPGNRGLTRLQMAMFAGILASPAGMLAIGKGNPELLLIAMGIIGLTCSTQRGPIGLTGPILLLLASTAKFFPAVTLVVAVVGSRGYVRLLALASMLVIVLVMALTSAEMAQILANTPVGTQNSFGSAYAVASLAKLLGLNERVLSLMPAGLAALAFIAGSFLGRWLVVAKALTPFTARELMLCAGGCGVYVASWSIFVNWEYRFLWLLLALPLVIRFSCDRLACRCRAVFLTLAVATPWLAHVRLDGGSDGIPPSLATAVDALEALNGTILATLSMALLTAALTVLWRASSLAENRAGDNAS